MSAEAVALAAQERVERLAFAELDARIDLLLAHGADRFEKVTADPRKMGYLRFLLRYYAKFPHPWTKCVHPDTLVDCPRDHEKFPEGKPISQMQTGDLVWSFNPDLHVFELKPIVWVARTRTGAQLAELTLDDGSRIKATPDHKFMRRDGSWAELQDLLPGDSLMPLYRDYLPLVRLRPDRAAWTAEHEMVGRRDPSRKGKHIHHEDERRINTDPSNLSLLTASEHASAHHASVKRSRDEERKCRYCDAVFTPLYRGHVTCGVCVGSNKWEYVKLVVGTERECARCDQAFTVIKPNQRFCSPACREASANKKMRRLCSECGISFKTRSAHSLCLQCRKKPIESTSIPIRACRNCGKEFSPETSRQVHCTPKCRTQFSKRSYAERSPVGLLNFNHKVVAVKFLSEISEVWDMEVEDNHNFVVHGVVLHNCVADNTKRFGPDKVKGLCGVLKDTLRQNPMWRHGAPRGPHPGHPDSGAPGAAIGEADKWAAPAWGGHHHMSEDGRPLSLLDELDMEFGVVDHEENIVAAAEVLCAIGERCDVYRVLIGLDEPPTFEEDE